MISPIGGGMRALPMNWRAPAAIGVGVGQQNPFGIGVGVGHQSPFMIGVGVGQQNPLGIGVGVGTRSGIGVGVGARPGIAQIGVGVGLFESVGTAIGNVVGGAMNAVFAVGVGAVLGYFTARLSIPSKKSRRR
jgi:hypothetical protein